MLPEEKRDAAIAAVEAVGGVIRAAEPLAEAADPHVVVAYRLRVGARTLEALQTVRAVQADTEISAAGLVPWQPLPIEEDEEAGGVE